MRSQPGCRGRLFFFLVMKGTLKLYAVVKLVVVVGLVREGLGLYLKSSGKKVVSIEKR